jgi:DNA-binding NarL/FixJ family response regulator
MPITATPGNAVSNLRKRILVVEDNPIMRQGICALLKLHPDLTVCGEAADSAEALTQIAATRPDFAVIDLTLRGGNGLDVIRQLRIRWPNVKSLVLSMHDDVERLEQVLAEGAGGFVAKDEAPEQLVRAIRAILRGERYLSPKALARLSR